MSAPWIRLRAAGTPGRRLLALAAALHVVLLGLWLSGALDGLFFSSARPGTFRDSLHSFYQAGVDLRAGLSPYTDPAALSPAVIRAHTISGFRYMPPVAWAFGAISAAVPPRILDWAWPILLEALLLFAVWLTLRARRYGEHRWAAAAMWLVFTPFLLELHLGQVSMLMAVGILMLLLESLGTPPAGRGWWGRRALDAVWALTLTIKAFTALLAVPYLRSGRRARVLVGAALVAATSGIWFAARPDELRQFLAVNGSPMLGRLFPGVMGLQALVRSITDPLLPAAWREGRMALGPLDITRGNLPSALACGAVLAIAVWATTRLRRDELFRGLALWVAAFFLIYRQVWEYHYLMLLPVVACVYLATGARWAVAAWALMALPTPYALLAGAGPGPAWALHHAMKPAAALIAFGFLAARPLRLRRPLPLGLPEIGPRPAYAGAVAAKAPAAAAGAVALPAGAEATQLVPTTTPSGNGNAPEPEPVSGPAR